MQIQLNKISSSGLLRSLFSKAIPQRESVTRFFILVFSRNQSPPPRLEYPIRTIFKFFQKFAEVFASQGAPPTTLVANLPPVSMTLAANFANSLASVVDTGGKFANGVNDTGNKFAAGAICPRYQ